MSKTFNNACPAFGGGSPMDAAKIMWVLYEHPEVHFADLAPGKFMDIRKRIYRFPKLSQGDPRRSADDLAPARR